MGSQQLGVADLALLEALFEPLIDSPFFVKNESFQYVAVNEAMLRLCGLSRRDQILGRTARDIFPSDAASRYELDERFVLAGNSIIDRLEAVVVQGFPMVWLLFSQVPVLDHKKRAVGIASTSRRIDLRRLDNATYARLARAIQHIRRSFDAPLNLKKLAAITHLSSSQLERDFRRLLGTTPRRYQQRVRIAHSFELLAQDHSIATIAQNCGFSDHSAFTRRFKEFTGMSPQKYRTERTVAPAHTARRGE